MSDERGGVGCELRSLVLVPIYAMAVVAHAFPVETALPRSASPAAFVLLDDGGKPAQAFISDMCVSWFASKPTRRKFPAVKFRKFSIST